MRAVFEHSWDLLSESEQACFMRLAVFRGGFTREAAATITGTDLDTLVRFVRKSLVQRDAVDGRFRIHRLSREYARGKLQAAGAFEMTRDLHMQYFTEFMHSRETDIKGGAQLEGLDLIEADFENVRAAFRWAVSHHQHERVNGALESIFWYCSMRGRIQKGEELLKEARERFLLGTSEDEHPVQWRLIVRFHASGSEYRNQLRDCLEKAKASGARAEEAHFLWALGVNGYVDHEFDRAVADLEQSLALHRELGDAFYAIESLHLLSVCSRFLGRLEDADRFEDEAIELCRSSGNRIALARALGSRGAWGLFRGEFGRAEKDLRQALALRQELGDRAGVAMCLVSLSLKEFFQGDIKRAQSLADRAHQMAESVHHLNSAMSAVNVMGWIAALEENYERAMELCRKSLSHAPDPTVTAGAELGLCLAASGMGDFSTARTHLRRTLRHYSALGGRVTALACLPVHAILAAEDGEQARAVELIAVAFSNSGLAQGWLNKWPLLTRLRTELEDQMGADDYGLAWTAGVDKDPTEVLADLLIELEEGGGR